MLQRTPHTAPSELRVKIGIQRLLDTDVYVSAFPLHDRYSYNYHGNNLYNLQLPPGVTTRTR